MRPSGDVFLTSCRSAKGRGHDQAGAVQPDLEVGDQASARESLSASMRDSPHCAIAGGAAQQEDQEKNRAGHQFTRE
jgi:hypothetical protein